MRAPFQAKARPALIGLGLLLAGCAPGSLPPESPGQKSPRSAAAKVELPAVQTLLERGDDATAERQLASLSAAGSSEARALLGELYLRTGRPAEVLKLFGEGRERALPESMLRARARYQEGEVEAALQELDDAHQAKATSWLKSLEAQVRRGTWLLELGERDRAEEILLSAVRVYENQDYERAGPEERATALTWIGRAAHLLGAFRDANQAYEEAEALAPASVGLLLFRAELFLEKYDTRNARDVLEEAQALGPRHPEVLFVSAAVELESTMNMARAGELARAALDRNPRHQKARALLAGIALRDLDFQGADRLLAEGLAQRPGDLDLLSVSAAVRFLAEDEAGFEQRLAEIFEKNEHYARVFLVVSEFAEWEHRYQDIERLLRRAARMAPDSGQVRGRLGLNLVRAGSDSAGVVELRRAFELDPYDVRVLNTLELFETILPARYTEQRQGNFVFRVPKAEEPWLMRYVPDLLEEAYRGMEQRYQFTPDTRTLIEIYESPEQFAVRTSGVPHIGIAGVCFGTKLATVSPRGRPANLGMTLWHELAHVFHIGLSRSRVPRFLTEGLAEWETARLDRGWSREMDLQLYEAILERRLPSLTEMNRAFTRAERLEDVGTAYYASGRMAAFLVETYGMAEVREVLARLGEHGLRPQVYSEALGRPTSEVNQAFLDWTQRDLARFRQPGQLVDLPRRKTRKETAKAAAAPHASRADRVDAARADLEAGKPELARDRLEALVAEELDAASGYWLARVHQATGQADAAGQLLSRVFATGADGTDLRLLMARLDLEAGRHAEARRELERAGELDPKRAEVWALLAGLAHEFGPPDSELAAVRRWAELSEHDGDVHRRLLELLLTVGVGSDAEQLVERAIWTDLANAETHRLAARVYERLGRGRQADFEWETALLCSEGEKGRAEVRAEWAQSLERRGQKNKADAVRRDAGRSP